jgi:hypothetical protein
VGRAKSRVSSERARASRKQEENERRRQRQLSRSEGVAACSGRSAAHLMLRVRCSLVQTAAGPFPGTCHVTYFLGHRPAMPTPTPMHDPIHHPAQTPIHHVHPQQCPTWPHCLCLCLCLCLGLCLSLATPTLSLHTRLTSVRAGS